MSELAPGPRRLDALLVAVSLATYFVALVDSADWVRVPLLVPVALFVVRAFVTRLPSWLVLIVTAAVVAPINFDLDAEGAFFFLCIAAFATMADDDRVFPSGVLVGLAAVSPSIVWALGEFGSVGSGNVREWNWPFWSMGIAISGFFGAIVRQQRRLNIALAEAQEQLAEQAADAERRRIAREVHDLVGHSLTVVLMHLTGARRLVRRDPEEAEAALLEAERAGRQSLAEIRQTVKLLRDAVGERTPTPSGRDIAVLIADSAAAGMELSADLRGPVDALEESAGLAAYRIVQESLANVARHAPGSSARVLVEVGAKEVVVEVTNTEDPVLPTVEPGSTGHGLLGIQERVAALGGTAEAGPTDAGWRVRAVIPRLDTNQGATP